MWDSIGLHNPPLVVAFSFSAPNCSRIERRSEGKAPYCDLSHSIPCDPTIHFHQGKLRDLSEEKENVRKPQHNALAEFRLLGYRTFAAAIRCAN